MNLRHICRDPDNGGGGGDAPDVAALQAEIETLKGQVATLTNERDTLKKGGGDAEVRRLKSELRTAKAELTTMTTERDTLKTKVSELEGTVTETTTKALLREHGIDPDDVDYVLSRYGKVEADADGHKPDLGEFLAEAKAGKQGWYTKIAAPSTAASTTSTTTTQAKPPPKTEVAATTTTTTQAAATQATTEPAATTTTTPAPKSPDAPAGKTVVTTKGGTGQYTADQIRAMSPKEYAAHRAAIRAAAGVPLQN